VIVEISVEQGEAAEAGQTIVRLDPTLARAVVDQLPYETGERVPVGAVLAVLLVREREFRKNKFGSGSRSEYVRSVKFPWGPWLTGP
jgi:hypothetical protein